MSFLQEQLHRLQLPPYPQDEQTLIHTLLTQEYGIVPAVEHTVHGRILTEDPLFCAGKETLQAASP